jgi:hypothetical protein
VAETAEAGAPERREGGRQGSAILVLEGLRRVPTPPDLLHSPALLVGSLFAIAGIIAPLALVFADRAQVAQAPALPLAA